MGVWRVGVGVRPTAGDRRKSLASIPGPQRDKASFLGCVSSPKLIWVHDTLPDLVPASPGGRKPHPRLSPLHCLSSRLCGWSSAHTTWGGIQRHTLRRHPLGQGGAGSGLPRAERRQGAARRLSADHPAPPGPSGTMRDCTCCVGCVDVLGAQINKLKEGRCRTHRIRAGT